jgi:hypothetical protein
MNDGWQMIRAGACSAWSLPADATCAGVARRLFRRTASALALDAEAIDDGETIVSELAANTLHVRCGQHSNGTCSMGRVSGHAVGEGDDSSEAGPPRTPELWLYLRGSGEQCELVCKVFDTCPGWAHGGAPGHGGHRAGADAMSGRGLEVVHELSHGRWGYHLTRARLGGWRMRGKAVWFSTPAPFAKPAVPIPWGQAAGSSVLTPAGEAMTHLEEELVTRGFGDTMTSADDPSRDTAVLSVCGELTVWCRVGCVWLRAPGHDGQAWGYGDLVEVAEQVVEAHETYCTEPDFVDQERPRVRA